MQKNLQGEVFQNPSFILFSQLTEDMPNHWIMFFARDIERNVEPENYDAAWKACIEGYRAGASAFEDEDEPDESFDSFVDEAIQDALDTFVVHQ